MFWAIFDRTDMKISLYRVVLRVEFDGDVCFFLAPPKSMFLLIFIDVFSNLFVFQVFVKILICFFPAAAAAATAAVAAAAKISARRGHGKKKQDFYENLGKRKNCKKH